MSGQSQPSKGGYGNNWMGDPYGGGYGGGYGYGPQQGSFYSLGGSNRGSFGGGKGGYGNSGLMPPPMMDTNSMLGSMGNPASRNTSGMYGNSPGQNGLVYTNGQFGFGNGNLAQLAPGTAAMLGFRNNGRGQWVNAQGQVVGTV